MNGGLGGGILKIDSSSLLRVDGRVSANGGGGSGYNGGGSGGSVLIDTYRLEGDGTIEVKCFVCKVLEIFGFTLDNKQRGL